MHECPQSRFQHRTELSGSPIKLVSSTLYVQNAYDYPIKEDFA